MKKRLVLLLSLLLALSVLLQGCLMPFPSDRFDYLTEETTEPTKPTDRGEPAEADSYLPYDEFPRPEEAELEPVAFEDMEYTRPDAAALCKALGGKGGGSPEMAQGTLPAAEQELIVRTLDTLCTQ